MLSLAHVILKINLWVLFQGENREPTG